MQDIIYYLVGGTDHETHDEQCCCGEPQPLPHRAYGASLYELDGVGLQALYALLAGKDDISFWDWCVSQESQGSYYGVTEDAARAEAIAQARKNGWLIINAPESSETSIWWGLPHGWRAGTRYVEKGASAADVIRYELNELGNDLDIPQFLLEELERKQVTASQIVWVCRTKEDALRYGNEPYREDTGPRACVLSKDPDNGYLVLDDARQLDQNILTRFALYRYTQSHLKGHDVEHDPLVIAQEEVDFLEDALKKAAQLLQNGGPSASAQVNSLIQETMQQLEQRRKEEAEDS